MKTCTYCQEPVKENKYSALDYCSENCYDERRKEIQAKCKKNRIGCRACGKDRPPWIEGVFCSYECRKSTEYKAKKRLEQDDLVKENKEIFKKDLDEKVDEKKESIQKQKDAKRNRECNHKLDRSSVYYTNKVPKGFGRTVRG